MKRQGWSLLELVIVLAIIGLIVALLLPAIGKIRAVAIRTQSINNLRQLILAVHHFAADNKNGLPPVDGNAKKPNGSLFFYTGPSLFEAILPYLEKGDEYIQLKNNLGHTPFIPIFISPADPTFQNNGSPVSSYAANAQVFINSPTLPTSIPDGTSNTIAFAEHYSRCQKATFFYNLTLTPIIGGPHRASFADKAEGDIYPVTTGKPPVTEGSEPLYTFQVAPTPPNQNCFPWVAQTPHPEGMLAALVDGSVRILDPGMTKTTYWGAVTPAGGETLGNDWEQ